MCAFHKWASVTNANVKVERGGAIKAINPLVISPIHFFYLPLSIISITVRAGLSGIRTRLILFVNILSTSALMRAFTAARGAHVPIHKLIKLLWAQHSKLGSSSAVDGSPCQIRLDRRLCCVSAFFSATNKLSLLPSWLIQQLAYSPSQQCSPPPPLPTCMCDLGAPVR